MRKITLVVWKNLWHGNDPGPKPLGYKTTNYLCSLEANIWFFFPSLTYIVRYSQRATLKDKTLDLDKPYPKLDLCGLIAIWIYHLIGFLGLWGIYNQSSWKKRKTKLKFQKNAYLTLMGIPNTVMFRNSDALSIVKFFDS